ncbi:hypothetical protein [Paraliomyxa miuraensis]|uniref:hypothetical protein n=1 Tax=Paraliomyxa miuraensis TaxID=376150 RepID=UPI0022572EDE|nr:hypothetical protein [Paraliomyxa miuraensis]MCX4240598.1 hypothetical protein [Paraliomyxa miuraensis]
MGRSPFVRDEAKQRLREAVQSVEARSSAEIVVAVQPWSASWSAVDGSFGAALAYVTLLYTLFAPEEFGLTWIALMVPAAFVVGLVLCRALPGLRMRLAGRGRVRRAVEQGARARFVELGVSATRERSGVLVYVSIAERVCVVVPDVGVVARVPKDAWAKAAARVQDAVAMHGVSEAGLAALCEAVQALAEVLEPPMPRREDDTNELEDVA